MRAITRRGALAFAGASLAMLLGCGRQVEEAGSQEGTAVREMADGGEGTSDNVNQGYDQGVIPAELEYIPAGYDRPATSQGTLERLEYQTWDSLAYDAHETRLTKTAWVYVPYGYSPDEPHDVVYLSHGGWSNETTLLGASDAPTSFKHVLDHAIEDGLIRPILVVALTYNNLSERDSADYGLALTLTDNYHQELVGDLMPAVESTYRTYAADVTPEGLAASRDHRAFMGFSMGSVNTWHALEHCLDYFRYFSPSSGNVGYDGATWASFVREQGHGPEDFFVFAMSGTDDFAYGGHKSQVMSMMDDPMFVEADREDEGNIAWRERAGYSHDFTATYEYAYNALRFFFNGRMDAHAQDGAQAAAVSLSPASYDVSTSIETVKTDSVLGDWGRLLFPADEGYMGGSTLGDISLTWYSTLDPQMTVDVVNDVRQRAAEGGTVFIDIYSDEEKDADPWKRDTGLFFFPGNPGARTAIVSAGGGFAYVGAMHDSLPHCMELARRGYNAFALIYRPGSQTACQDLARAISYLHDHAAELGISMDGYSLWGGSAGARMSAWLGTYGTEAFGEGAYPRPALCVVNYTGLSEVTGDEPPTYSAVGTSDWIASWQTMQRRIERIQANGTPAQIEVFQGLGHGFGIGTGTAAEGWLDRAVTFWEEQPN